MTTDFYNLLLTDCALAAVLLALFLYVGRESSGVRGIATWGVAHFLYSLGAAMLDGTAQELARAGDDRLAHWTAGRSEARRAGSDWGCRRSPAH